MNNFDLFCGAVRREWPRYRTTPEELHGPWVDCCHDCPPSDVALAFQSCKRNSPDRPHWLTILADLRQRAARRRGLAFRKLLEDHRDATSDKSDGEVWASYLKEGARRITHRLNVDRGVKPMVVEFRKKESGPCTVCQDACKLSELECRATRWTDDEVSRWINYLAECGAEIPAYLSM